MPRDFRLLTAWRKADDLVLEVYRQSSLHFPPEERYGLRSQLRRSAVSVAANLAEGTGRRTEEEFRQFLYVARGSLAEVEYYLHLARRLGFLPEESYTTLTRMRKEVGRVLSGLIATVSRQVQGRRTRTRCPKA